MIIDHMIWAINSPYREIEDDGINTKCAICGSNINAGSYPPVCRQSYQNCYNEWDIEISFNRFAVRELEKYKKQEDGLV